MLTRQLAHVCYNSRQEFIKLTNNKTYLGFHVSARYFCTFNKVWNFLYIFRDILRTFRIEFCNFGSYVACKDVATNQMYNIDGSRILGFNVQQIVQIDASISCGHIY